MNKRYFLFGLIVILNSMWQLFAQGTDSLYTKQLNSDLEYFQEALYSSHPAPFAYASKAKLDSLFRALRFKGQGHSHPVLELEKRIRKIICHVGCSHTSVRGSVFKPNKKVLPFEVFMKDNSLWVLRDLEGQIDSVKSYRLLSINDNSADSIIAEILNYRGADGYNKSFIYAIANRSSWFNYLYQYYFDQDSIKSYVLVDEGFDTLRVERKVLDPEKKIPVKQNETAQTFGKNIHLTTDKTEDMAVLRIKSFSTAMFYGRRLNVNRFKRVLKQVEDDGIENLVIDLRNNSGGNAQLGYNLVSFFIPEKHTVFVRTHNGEIFRYAKFSSKIGIVLNNLFGNFVSSRIPTFKNRISKVNVRSRKKRHFSGDVYIVTNGITLSTASNVASMLKHKTDAVLVGSETGGGEEQLNAYLNPKMVLPHSKIKIQIAQLAISLGVTEDVGSGVVPAIPIDYSPADIKEKCDLEMKAIIMHIKNKQ